MTCPVSSEPEDQLCILKCQHTLSLNNLKKLKQKICPECREKIEEDDIRYLSQNSIYKYLYTKFSESGHILPSIELENSDQIYDSDDSDNSEADLILIKKKNFMNLIIKLNSNISLSSIFPKFSKKQHPTYQSIIKELNKKHYYNFALENYNIVLKNDPNNYFCLKSCAYSYEKNREFSKSLKMLDKLLNINKDDSLILCYYGEILCNMIQYNDAILYFTKANIIDPENTHNLNKRAITYYILQEYDKVLLDLDKIIRLDPLNSLAYYLKCLTYYTKKDIDNAKIVFKKYKKLFCSDNNILAKIQLFHLEYLLNKTSSEELNCGILTKINQVSNIENNNLLLLIRCKIYIELKMFHEAKSDLELLYQRYFSEYISYIYLLQEYMDFWLSINVNNNNDFSTLGIINEFSKYIYEKLNVYLISNLVNLNSELYQFQENDANSLSGKVINSKNEKLHLDSPTLDSNQQKHMLKYEDLSKLEGLGWIEYQLPITAYNPQLSIEINGSINMFRNYSKRTPDNYNQGHIPYVKNF
ncbi:TPR-like protein [Rhizophagus irregularis]|nr:TPR-like protein [Rhizophagus irregularis]